MAPMQCSDGQTVPLSGRSGNRLKGFVTIVAGLLLACHNGVRPQQPGTRTVDSLSGADWQFAAMPDPVTPPEIGAGAFWQAACTPVAVPHHFQTCAAYDDLRANFANIKALGFDFLQLADCPHAWIEYDPCGQTGIPPYALNGHSKSPDIVSPTAARITTEMMKQNYNHPSIVVWSMWNKPNAEAADECVSIAKAIDSTSRSRCAEVEPGRLSHEPPLHRDVLVATKTD